MLSVGIVLESFSMRTAVVESNRVRGSASWMHFIRRSRTPELPVVLLEDLGALLGLVLALGALAIARGSTPGWDGIGTLSIGAAGLRGGVRECAACCWRVGNQGGRRRHSKAITATRAWKA